MTCPDTLWMKIDTMYLFEIKQVIHVIEYDNYLRIEVKTTMVYKQTFPL